MKTSWKKILGIALSVAMVSALAAGCGNNGNSSSKEKIAVVCSASGQNDNGYNQSAVDGLKAIADELGYAAKIVEPTNGVPNALETLAKDGYKLIFSLEYDFDALIKGVGGDKPLAEKYPNTHFVVFNDNPNVNDDGSVRHQNVTSVLFDVHEASYLAGYLSVQLNENQATLFPSGYSLTPLDKSRGIGFIGGTNSNGILVYSYGFMQGINAAAKEYGVTYDYYAKYDAGFTDSALGSTVAGTFYNNGANIVFADAGTVGDGITTKAKELGKIAIQTDANLDTQQPGHVLTSVLKITGVPGQGHHESVSRRHPRRHGPSAELQHRLPVRPASPTSRKSPSTSRTLPCGRTSTTSSKPSRPRSSRVKSTLSMPRSAKNLIRPPARMSTRKPLYNI